MKAAVLARRPAFRKIIRDYGVQSLYDYMREYVASPVSASSKARQAELVAAVGAQTEEQLGAKVARSVEAQLKKYYGASTMDHCGPVYHPWSLNYDLVASIVCMEHSDPVLQNVITLAFSNVSLNNFSFPRGISFHAEDSKGAVRVHRLPFFPNKLSTSAVFNLAAYTYADIARMKDAVLALGRCGECDPATAKNMEKLLDDVYAAPDVLACRTYTDQITKVNHALWKRVCTQRRPRKDINFVYLEQESLVARLLAQHHMHTDTLLHRLLFDKAPVTAFMRYFDRLPEAFSVWEKRGTYLFWALPKGAKRRMQLWKKGNQLVTDDGSYAVDLTPEALSKALTDRELIPGTLISLLTLSFYYGLRCFGGMGQVTYLPEHQQAYMKLCRDLGERESLAVCAPVETQDLGGEMTVAFLECAKGALVPATSIDLLLYGDERVLSRVACYAKDLTLDETLDFTLPTEYPMLYRGEERRAELHAITIEDITSIVQQSGRLRPALSMCVKPAGTLSIQSLFDTFDRVTAPMPKLGLKLSA